MYLESDFKLHGDRGTEKCSGKLTFWICVTTFKCQIIWGKTKMKDTQNFVSFSKYYNGGPALGECWEDELL